MTAAGVRWESGWPTPTVTGMNRTNRIAAGALAIVLIGALALLALTRTETASSIEAIDTTTSSTSTTTTSTTTTLPVTIDTHENLVATALLPKIDVTEAAPAGLDTVNSLAAREGAARRATFPAFSPERGDAPEFPSLTEAIEGRRRTPTGWEFDNPSPMGAQLSFMVMENYGDWLKVQMPVRPNGREGWIKATDVTLSTNHSHITINLGERSLKAFANGQQTLETKVVVGKEDTRTPTGRFYVTDFEEKYPGSAYGSWILPLNAYSQDLDEFGGGVPLIAMHGTNAPELVGQARSNGCIRMPDEAIIFLRANVPIGTSVDIVG